MEAVPLATALSRIDSCEYRAFVRRVLVGSDAAAAERLRVKGPVQIRGSACTLVAAVDMKWARQAYGHPKRGVDVASARAFDSAPCTEVALSILDDWEDDMVRDGIRFANVIPRGTLVQFVILGPPGAHIDAVDLAESLCPVVSVKTPDSP